ncbi:MAG TPA: hypothetical protein VF615_26885 [Longimicrobiaceae bacterium]|jgi:hypothetical protein
MDQNDRAEELRGRIRDSAGFHGEPLPWEAALAWHGYLAAALEWGLISVAQHAALSGMLPEPPGAVMDTLFLDREEDGESPA